MLLRLSTFLLVPLVALSGLGSMPHDRPGDADPRTVVRARALTAVAADAQPAEARTPSAQPPTASTGAPQTAGDPTETVTVEAKKAKAKEAEAKKAKAKKARAAEAKKAKKARAAKAKKAKAARAGEAKKGKKARAAEAKKARAAKARPAAVDVRPRSLYLAVGHGRAPNGRWQPGAEHPGTGGVEVDAAQIMVDAMVEVLRDAPGVQLTFESGDHPNVIGSVAAANAAGVDDCVEVHQDTVVAPPGAFAHWYTGSTEAKRLADGLVGSIQQRGVPIRTNWHRERPGLYFLRKSLCRAVLVEVGRVDDYGPDKLRELGHGMAEAYLADTAAARGVEVS